MKKLLITLVLFCAAFQVLKAQQLPLYSQYFFNRYGFNPAYAGNQNYIDSRFTHRNHLMGLPGAPVTQLVTASMPIQKYYIGTGIKFMYDQLGVSNNFALSGAANYYIGFGEGKLSAGIEIGMAGMQVRWEDLNPVEIGDNALPMQNKSIIVPDAGFGLFYNTETWYVGYSIQQLLLSRMKFTDYETDNPANFAMHHYVNAGAAFVMSEELKLNIEPHTLIKKVAGAPIQMDLSTFVVYNQMAGVGVAFRTHDAIYFVAKYDLLDMVTIGYSYGVRVNGLSPYSSSSHEILLGYKYKLMEPAKKKVVHPIIYF